MRFEYRAAGPIAAASILLLVSACSRAQQDWRVAQQAGTAQAYDVFVARHPDSELAGVARERAAQLTERAVWQEATRANSVAAYRGYLARYPDGSWSQDARIRMENESLMAQAPQRASATAPAADSVAAPAPAGRSTVQLGAFSTVANAQSAWSQLSSRYRPRLEGMTPRIVPVMSSARRLYRLEVRVADPATARSLCRQLQQHSQGCLPVP